MNSEAANAEENDNVLPQPVYSYDNVIKINEENEYVEMEDYEWIYDGDITVGIKYISTEKEYRVDEGLMLNKEENLMEYKEFKSLVDEDNSEAHSIEKARHLLILVAIFAMGVITLTSI